MHVNIQASKNVKHGKSMVFLLPTVTEEEIKAVYKAPVPTNTFRQLQNLPGSIYKYSFITFRREVIDIW